MVRRLHTLLSMMFNQGIRLRVVSFNPCRGAILPLPQTPDIEVFTQDEARAFISTCYNNPDWLVLAFALETAMRPGEVLGLRWRDVDGTTVTVRQAVAFPKTGPFYFKPPKTKASKRSIRITEKLHEALVEHRRRQLEYIASLQDRIKKPLLLDHKKAKGTNYDRRQSQRSHAKDYLAAFRKYDLVFPASNGGPMSPHNLGVRFMKEACDAALVPRRSLYALRHTSLSLLIAAGVDIKSVSHRAGHSNISTTLSTYIHLMSSMQSESDAKLIKVLYG
jgi:integrase